MYWWLALGLGLTAKEGLQHVLASHPTELFNDVDDERGVRYSYLDDLGIEIAYLEELVKDIAKRKFRYEDNMDHQQTILKLFEL